MGRITPAQLIIFSFLCAIALGTVALSLPIATVGPERLSLVDSLFTATSATCVTGLVVKDTGAYFTHFGRWVIFILFQIGGLGIMTFSTLFAVILGRKIGFRQSDVIEGTLASGNILGLRRLIGYILTITFAIEAVGATSLFLRWRAVTDWTVIDTAERAVFHSVSGFCNAGFALFQTSLEKFAADPYINLIMMLLIFFGGIGFIVNIDMLGFLTKRGPKKKVTLQTKMVLVTTLILIAVGTLAILLFENDGVLQGMSWGDKTLGALFQSVTSRTAGFNTLAIGKMAAPTLLVLVFLMFIGASPGSTGGGIKTCTFAVLAVTVWNMMKNNRQVMVSGRTIPRQVVREAIVIFFLAVSWVFVFSILVMFFQEQSGTDASLVRTLFEVVSAFGTVGLSTGITPDLDTASKLCIIATMFAGRVGPLTLALAVAFRDRRDNYVYPEESVMVG